MTTLEIGMWYYGIGIAAAVILYRWRHFFDGDRRPSPWYTFVLPVVFMWPALVLAAILVPVIKFFPNWFRRY